MKIRHNEAAVEVWELIRNKKYHSTLNWACDYLPVLGLKFHHISKRGLYWLKITHVSFIIPLPVHDFKYVSQFIHYSKNTAILSVKISNDDRSYTYWGGMDTQNDICSYQFNRNVL